MKTKQLKLNAPLRGLPRGAIVAVAFENDVALDPYWRARMLDAQRDSCVEIVSVKKPLQKPTAKNRETKITGPDQTKTPDKMPDKMPDKTIEKKG